MRIRINVTVHNALLASLTPPRLSLCRCVLPDDASIGLTPQSAANEDSFFRRSGLSPAATNSVAATYVPTPYCSIRLGAQDDVRALSRLSIIRSSAANPRPQLNYDG